jgi:2',3'-cyclic-nucleotide 2'-phosphodiesterase (5'-nucleotidase family)
VIVVEDITGKKDQGKFSPTQLSEANGLDRSFNSSWLNELHATHNSSRKHLPTQKESTQENNRPGVEKKQTVIEVGSSLTAGLSGTVVFSLATALATKRIDKVLALPAALGMGGLLKLATKAGLQESLLEEKEHNYSSKDIAWGAVDTLTGIGASKAEALSTSRYMARVGWRELGKSLSPHTAEEAGKVVAQNSLKVGLSNAFIKGSSGGATGAFLWSTPHRLADNWQQIKEEPARGLTNTGMAVGQDTALGATFGGSLGVFGTAVYRRGEILGKIQTRINAPGEVYRQNTFHINDFHSNTEQLPRLKTKLDELGAQATQDGIPSRFIVPGDIESGRVNYAFTKGRLENKALIDMGVREIIPGNHAYDAPGSLFKVNNYLQHMEPLLAENPQVSLLAANLDASAHPQYQNLLKPYTIRQAQAPWGEIKIGTIGVTTEEGALDGLVYQDATEQALKYARSLKDNGADVLEINTHIGLGEDIKLAEAFLDHNINVAQIVGGHSHDVLPRPLWVAGKVGTAGEGKAIPIFQAGHSGNWMGEIKSVINRDGTANRYLTQGKLHPIDSSIAEDQGMRKFIDQAIPQLKEVREQTYNASAKAPYSAANVRNRETPMGNLMADATLKGLQNRLQEEAPAAVLVHSGGIRSGIKANPNISRLDLSNVVMHAGTKEGETKELLQISLTGNQLKKALEYGVADKASPEKPALSKAFKDLFTKPPLEHVDESGNFLQVSGLRYSYDARRQALKPNGTGGDRIVSLEIANQQGQFQPVDPSSVYSIATRFHPVERWWKYGIFGDKPLTQVHQEIGAKPLPHSQVDFLADYISNKTLDPKIVSAVDGRAKDLAPTIDNELLRPGKSLSAAPFVAGYTFQNPEKKDKEP